MIPCGRWVFDLLGRHFEIASLHSANWKKTMEMAGSWLRREPAEWLSCHGAFNAWTVGRVPDPTSGTCLMLNALWQVADTRGMPPAHTRAPALQSKPPESHASLQLDAHNHIAARFTDVLLAVARVLAPQRPDCE